MEEAKRPDIIDPETGERMSYAEAAQRRYETACLVTLDLAIEASNAAIGWSQIPSEKGKHRPGRFDRTMSAVTGATWAHLSLDRLREKYDPFADQTKKSSQMTPSDTHIAVNELAVVDSTTVSTFDLGPDSLPDSVLEAPPKICADAQIEDKEPIRVPAQQYPDAPLGALTDRASDFGVDCLPDRRHDRVVSGAQIQSPMSHPVTPNTPDAVPFDPAPRDPAPFDLVPGGPVTSLPPPPPPQIFEELVSVPPKQDEVGLPQTMDCVQGQPLDSIADEILAEMNRLSALVDRADTVLECDHAFKKIDHLCGMITQEIADNKPKTSMAKQTPACLPGHTIGHTLGEKTGGRPGESARPLDQTADPP